jgi:hypothetical protein
MAMSFIEEGTGIGVMRFLNAVKDLPLWLLAALAITIDIFVLVPKLSADVSNEGKPWLVFSAILFTVLAFARAISVGLQFWRSWAASRDARRTFHLTPIKHQCLWSVSKQSDDSFVTQIVGHFTVRNRTQVPLGLVTARLIKPRVRGEVLQDIVSVRAPDRNIYGTMHVSGYVIPPGMTLPCSVAILIRGQLDAKSSDTLTATLGIVDDSGNEQRVKVPLKGVAATPPRIPDTPAPSEAAYKISDPIEKQVVPVLQFELSRYDKCGRRVGGLGSVHLIYQGNAMNGVGGRFVDP